MFFLLLVLLSMYLKHNLGFDGPTLSTNFSFLLGRVSFGFILLLRLRSLLIIY